VQGYQVCNIDYVTIGQSVQDMVDETSIKIDECVKTDNRVNFVGHSLGGLVIRSYLADRPSIEQDRRLGRVVTLGTPHHGSEVADTFDGGALIKVAGEVSQSLVTGERSLGNQLPLPTYELGAIAGTDSSFTTERFFDGVNDGLVSLESSKVEGMQDFIALDVTHIDMPYDLNAAYQSMHFLQTGQFDHRANSSHSIE
jgi:pimeloyl-ACP methyl ester carboxylesterase